MIIYREIKSGEDELEFQEDLERLEKWENDWQMVFYPEQMQGSESNKRYEQEKQDHSKLRIAWSPTGMGR